MARVFLFLLLSLSGRATSFSATPTPPRPPAGGSGHAGDDEQQLQQSGTRLRNPTTKESIAFTARIKKSRSAKDGIRVILDIEDTSGCFPDVFQYSAAISKCAKERQVTAALSLLKRMVNQGVAPDVVVFGAVIDACANDGQYRRAIVFLNDMEETYGVRPNLTCFNSAVHARRQRNGKKL